MHKTIFIEARQAQIIKESEEVTYFQFDRELRKYLGDLLKDPVNTEFSDFFKSHGINEKDFKSRLIDRNIITKKEKISEPYDEAKGKKVGRYFVSYQVPKKNFDKKVGRLYNEYFG